MRASRSNKNFVHYPKRELVAGIKIESEHASTANALRKYCKAPRTCPTNKQIFTMIAKDHLSEDPGYYTKLKKAKL